MKYRNMGGEERNAAVMAANDRRWIRPEVVDVIKKNNDKHTRGKRCGTIEKAKAAKKVKKERRESAFN